MASLATAGCGRHSEVRFWQQSNRLIQAEPLYLTARRQAASARPTVPVAKLFWWFNQGAAVDVTVTPKPYYGADGNKVFGIHGTPVGLTERLGTPARPVSLSDVLGTDGRPAVYAMDRGAPRRRNLDGERLDLRRHADLHLHHLGTPASGPKGCDMKRLVGELDDACAAAGRCALRRCVWVVSEYGHVGHVSHPIYPNRVLREAKLLDVRTAPSASSRDLFTSRAFAVLAHHQSRHDVPDPGDVPQRRRCAGSAARRGNRRRRATWAADVSGLAHECAGDVIVLSPSARFAYPFWLDDRRGRITPAQWTSTASPATTRELFFDPKLWWPKGQQGRCGGLVQKKLGFRTLFDVVPLDAGLATMASGRGLTCATGRC